MLPVVAIAIPFPAVSKTATTVHDVRSNGELGVYVRIMVRLDYSRLSIRLGPGGHPGIQRGTSRAVWPRFQSNSGPGAGSVGLW